MVGRDATSNGDISKLDFTQWATDFGLEALAPLKSGNIHGTGIKQEAIYKSQVPGE